MPKAANAAGSVPPPRVILDCNVLVSALLSRRRHPQSAPALIMAAIMCRRLVPLRHWALLARYEQVLSRPRFGFPAALIHTVLETLAGCGQETGLIPGVTGLQLSDP